MKTERDLRDCVEIRRLQQGSYKITITYRGKKYSCVSNNSLAWDDLGAEWNENRSYYKTDKQCLRAFYNECKIKNGL